MRIREIGTPIGDENSVNEIGMEKAFRIREIGTPIGDENTEETVGKSKCAELER